MVADGRDVGLVLWQHPTHEELDVVGLHEIPAHAIDIDIMIGEPDAAGRGVGSTAIRLVAAAAFADPAVPFVMAHARVGNRASQQAFSEVGSRADREFDDVRNGRHLSMVCPRWEGAAS